MSTIYAKPGAQYRSTADGAPTGLTGTIGVTIYNDDGTQKVARSTAHIAESPPNSGRYVYSGTAPAESERFIVFWDTGEVTPETTTSDELIVTTEPPETPEVEEPEGLKPTLREVARYIRTRTRTPGGKLAGTFNNETEPRGSEVQSLLDENYDWLMGQASPCDDKPKLQKQFTSLVALATAIEAESTFWPDQVGTERSNYTQLKEWYDARIKLYTEGVEEQCPESDDPSEGGAGSNQLAQGDFPDAAGFGDMRF